MPKAGKQILICAAFLIVFCLVCRFVFFNTYNAYFPIGEDFENINEETRLPQDHGQSLPDGPAQRRVPDRTNVNIEIEQTDVLRQQGEPDVRNGYLRVPLVPEKRGEADVRLSIGEGNLQSYRVLRVSRFRTVYDMSTGNFTGDTAVLIAITLFWLLVSSIMLWHFSQAKGVAFYSYATIYYAGFSLFALVTGMLMLRVTVAHIVKPEEYPMFAAYSIIDGASKQFMMLTTPMILLFALAMAVSNTVLLTHERTRLDKLLGLLVSVLLIVGEAIGWGLFTRDFIGSELQGRINSTFENTYATVFVYFECMLAGSVICAVTAAKHEPALDKDFIVILGCWFRKDGTLPPLLRGRVDKAISFWRKQKEQTGKEAYMIPSGGQGKDESMPEAEAMRRYLLSQDIPERLILPETRSANTYQNMAYSKEIIQKAQPDGKAVFATTNYHVFRSGIWASLVGFAADGMGSKTKWWFWPNAFMRETVGLLKNRWKQELLFLLMLIIFFGLLTMVVG